MSALLLTIAVGSLAYSNGANDKFKGVASLFGSGAAVFLAEALLRTFSGKDLVPDTLAMSSEFVFAVAMGAGLTVISATLLGFPILTTHGLTSALVGAGVLAAGDRMDLTLLGEYLSCLSWSVRCSP